MTQLLSGPQKAVFAGPETKWTMCLAGGAIRSGKTLSTTMAFALWSAMEGPGHDHAVVGQSIESVMRNAVFTLIEAYRSIGCRAELSKSVGTRVVVHTPNGDTFQVWVIGTSDARAFRRIQGATLKGLLIDEVVLLPKNAFFTLWGRLSAPRAKCWATFNPESPAHWFKKEVVDNIENFNGVMISFLLSDNPSLEKDTVDRYDASFTGHWHTRMIKGLWAGASGLVFPEWHETDQLPVPHTISFGLDWGVSSVFAALAIAHRGQKAVVVDELYHDARKQDVWTENEQVSAFLQWAGPYVENSARRLVYCDPSTPASFKRLLRENGFQPRNADNDVVPGIVTTASRLKRKDICIHPSCVMLKEELSGYSWDETATERGEDKPDKVNDHACDALRYFAYTTGKAYSMAVPTPTKNIGF